MGNNFLRTNIPVSKCFITPFLDSTVKSWDSVDACNVTKTKSITLWFELLSTGALTALRSYVPFDFDRLRDLTRSDSAFIAIVEIWRLRMEKNSGKSNGEIWWSPWVISPDLCLERVDTITELREFFYDCVISRCQVAPIHCIFPWKPCSPHIPLQGPSTINFTLRLVYLVSYGKACKSLK